MQVQLRAFPTTRHAAIFVAGAHTETAPVARGIYCSAHDTSAYSRGSPPARGAVLLFVSLQTGTTGERFCSPSCTSTTAPGTFRASPALCGVTGPEHTVLSRHVVGKKQKSPPRRTPWQRLHRHTPPPLRRGELGVPRCKHRSIRGPALPRAHGCHRPLPRGISHRHPDSSAKPGAVRGASKGG